MHPPHPITHIRGCAWTRRCNSNKRIQMTCLPAFCSSSALASRQASLTRLTHPLCTPNRLRRNVTFNSTPSRRRRTLRYTSPNAPVTACDSTASRHPSSAVSSEISAQIKDQTLVVTTPLFYANAAPHMGSAYPTIAADALCRFYRLAGGNPILITGCDEHGEKIAAAAATATSQSSTTNSLDNSSTKLFVDEIASHFQSLWKKLNIQYDKFVRTTDKKHSRIVEQILERVWQKGDIYKDLYDGLYCQGCEEYKVESDLEKGNICPTHLKPCERRTEENYFFALSKYQQQLEQLLQDPNSQFNIQPAERRNEVLGWVKSGVRDFSVSRANNTWGIPIPRDASHTIYVWFDALIGYISGLYPEEDNGDINDLATRGWPAHVHIIGKDILRFHAVYWPAMLMSADLPLPKRVIGHGFITKDGMKMGKSLGNTLDPDQLVTTYGSDAVRFFFLRAVDFGRDGDFSQVRFVDTVNADLANSLGNLLNRSVNLARKNCKDGLQATPLDVTQDGAESCSSKSVIDAANVAANESYRLYAEMDFVGACEYIMRISYEANAYIDRVAPWTKFKSDNENDVAMANECIAVTLEACRMVAVGLSPVTPLLSQKIYVALGLEEKWNQGICWEEDMRWGSLLEGNTFSKPKPVFPRLEIETAEKEAVLTQ